jgi:serine/threonine protein kinase
VQIKLQHLLKTLMETAYAMRHLHNMHILHRDLKIQNILLKSSNKDSRGFTVKVSDFGLAKIWDGRGRGHSPTEKQKYAGVPPQKSTKFQGSDLLFVGSHSQQTGLRNQ